MFSDPQAVGGLLSSHWTVVIFVGLIFFSLQVVLSVRVARLLRRQERLLARLWQDRVRGGNGRQASDEALDNFAWLQWVLAVFPTGTEHPGANYTRDSILQELDARLASNSSYLLLQRMGVMAPLLGVILTVAGFWYLRVEDSGEMRLQDILFAVLPLVSGVGTGAVLALVNQGLVHWVSQRIESLRMVARTWFDAVIWNSVGLDSQSATATGIAAVERMAIAISAAAASQTDCTGRLTASASAINDSACEFRRIVHHLGASVEGVPKTLSELTSAIQASSIALKDVVHVGSRAAANLDVSVAAFRTTVDREFANVAKQQLASIHDLAGAIRQIGATTESLTLSSQELRESVDSSRKSVRLLNDALGQRLVPSQLQLQTTVDGLSACLQVLAKNVESLAGQLTSVSSNSAFFDAAASFTSSAKQLSSFVDDQVADGNKRLADLNNGLIRLGTTLAAFQRFTRAREDVDQLVESLGRFSHAMHLLENLPEETLARVQQNTSANQQTPARVRIANWFRNRAGSHFVTKK